MRSLLIFITVVMTAVAGHAQAWQPVDPAAIPARGQRDIVPRAYQAYALDAGEIRQILWSAPHERNQDPRTGGQLLQVGLADGRADVFRVVQYDMMEAPLAARYPGIRTFRGVSVSNPHRRLRADWTTGGFRAVITEPGRRTFIDPFQRGDTGHVIAYDARDAVREDAWSCGVTDAENKADQDVGQRFFGDCLFRTYRMAVATTGEYSNFFGATSSAQSDLVLAEVVTAINRNNEVYEADLAVRFLLIANTDDVFYYDPATDPYSGSACNQLGQNQTTMTNVIGSANYDIGHVFSVGSGGCAGLSVLCNNSNKARGATGLNPPTGDPFYIDYVAHEIGHQFGGNHTQNQTCNRSANSAYEPGSASTIMGYAGICPPNVQSNSDAYFHARSLLEMSNHITSVNCHQTLSFNNDPPEAQPVPDYTIPISTPFVLTADATDPDGDPLTYCWEQYDLEATSSEPPAANDPDGPMFRTFDPSPSPSRYFPRLSDLVQNISPQFEVLPSVTRPLNFRMTVRDYNTIGGCTDHDDVQVDVTATAGPFQVTSQNAGATWLEGENVTITWNVANTTASPVSCALVDIYLSYDGGLTYPEILAENIDNDGSAVVTIPPGTTTTGRVMVKASDNIFFDINNTHITINPGLPNYTLLLDPSSVAECNDGEVMTTVVVGQFMGYSDPVSLSAANLPPGAVAIFIPPVVIPGSNSTLTISGLAGLSGMYVVEVEGSSTTGTQQRNFSIDLQGTPAGSVSLTSPADNETGVLMNPLLVWAPLAGATEYHLEVAENNTFADPVISVFTDETEYQVQVPLMADVAYYWRIRPGNACGEGSWSAAYVFTTASCFLLYSTDVPVAISSSGANTVTSELPVTIPMTITDLDIIDLEGLHSYVDDLQFTLISPQGTERLFWNRPCANHDNFDINFDDEAPPGTWPCPPVNGLTYRPDNTLDVFDGEPSLGTWTLEVADLFNQDGGSLQRWALKVCGTPPCQLLVSQPGPSGAGSLREAVSCAASGDTVRLGEMLSGQTIDMGPGVLMIDKDLVILSEGTDIGISGSGTRILEVAAGVQVVLDGMRLIAGTDTDSGAIRNSGQLTLIDVVTEANPTVPGATLVRNLPGGELFLQGACQITE